MPDSGAYDYTVAGLLGKTADSYGVIGVNGEAIALLSSLYVTFHEGDVVRLRLSGGGGHGDSAWRCQSSRTEAAIQTAVQLPNSCSALQQGAA